MTQRAIQTATTHAAHTHVKAQNMLQRKCACGQNTPGGGSCATCSSDENELKRKPLGAANSSYAPGIVHDVLNSGGQPLDRSVRSFMEPRFSHDFSSVRIHHDAQANDSVKAVNAVAYTVGNHIAFATNHYSPQTDSGQKLLAHELTHVVQQSHHAGVVNRAIKIGHENSPAETEADRVADQVTSMQTLPNAPHISRAPAGGMALQRQPTTPQRRGDRARLANIDLPNRGDDEVKIKIFRYLCDCEGRDITRTSFDARVQPRPGVTFLFCRGRDTLRVTGEVEPSSLTTGSATVTADFNRAPGPSGVGGRVQVQGEARNTGSEPEVGGRVQGTLETPPGSPDVTASGEVFGGTSTGRVNTRAGVGVRIGDTTISLDATNPQDSRRAVTVGIGGTFGGQPVQRDMCRQCDCPTAYDCLEDIPPRPFEEQVPFTVREKSRLRYYFRLNSELNARDASLQAESTRSVNQVVQEVNSGSEIFSIKGFASPEAGEATRNLELSTKRAEKLHSIIAPRLGPDATLPAPEPGGELLGSRPTIAPGSTLADAILDTGFGNAEDVSGFLFGDEISNDQLADQFLALLNRVAEPEDRLRLFGVRADSPIAAQLLSAISQFIARGGRGRRPWESVFEFLRFATVELIKTREEVRTEQRTTRGSLRSLGQTVCDQFARQAERDNLFGPKEAEPASSQCPQGSPVNAPEYADKCRYRQ